jgi:hypothetical protein
LKNAQIAYLNESAHEAAQRIDLDLDFLLPFYRAAFEAFTVSMNEWCLSHDPLQALCLLFNVNHHFRIKELARQFGTAEPIPNQAFDAVGGAAAARLAYDLGIAQDVDMLQERAARFLRTCAGATQIIEIRTEPSS